MLSAEQIETFRMKLEAARSEIETQLAHVADDMSFGQETEDAEEEADEAEEISNRLGVRSSLKEQLSHITAALQKIAAGTYGVCERCGNGIETEVLAVDPESLLCRNCKRGTRNAS